MMYPVGKWGKIVNGEYSGWSIKIDDDTQGDTGGFYIYYVKEVGVAQTPLGEGYDNWVENSEALDKFFENIDFQIDWS